MSRKIIPAGKGRTLKYAFVFLALVTIPRVGLAQLSVSQPDVFLKSNLASRRSAVLRITNQANQVAYATLQIQDWHRDETGASAFLPLGTTAGSCREQLKISPSNLRIDPHETEHVRVSFEGEYDRSCWAIVFLQPSEAQPASAHSQPTHAANGGVKVYVQPEWARREAAVQNVALGVMRTSAQDPQVRCIEVLLRNTGDAHLETLGAVEIRNAANLVLATLDIERFPLAPADQRRIRVALPKLPPGRYTAVALFEYAGRDVAERETQFEIR